MSEPINNHRVPAEHLLLQHVGYIGTVRVAVRPQFLVHQLHHVETVDTAHGTSALSFLQRLRRNRRNMSMATASIFSAVAGRRKKPSATLCLPVPDMRYHAAVEVRRSSGTRTLPRRGSHPSPDASVEGPSRSSTESAMVDLHRRVPRDARCRTMLRIVKRCFSSWAVLLEHERVTPLATRECRLTPHRAARRTPAAPRHGSMTTRASSRAPPGSGHATTARFSRDAPYPRAAPDTAIAPRQATRISKLILILMYFQDLIPIRPNATEQTAPADVPR